MTRQNAMETVPEKPIPTKDSPDRDKKKHKQEKLDEALEESFPASDPVSLTNPSVPRSDDNPRGKKDRHRH